MRGKDRAAVAELEPLEISTRMRYENFRRGEGGRAKAYHVHRALRRAHASEANKELRERELDETLRDRPADPRMGGLDVPRDADPAVLAAAVVAHRRRGRSLSAESARRLLSRALMLGFTVGKDGGATAEIYKLLLEREAALVGAARPRRSSPSRSGAR